MSTEHFVGVDVSKDKLDVAVYPNKQIFKVDNNQSGLDELVPALQNLKPSLIVFESTGGYELLAVTALHAAKLPVVIVNARQIRDFAKSIGKLAKTDTIDALVIAQYASAVKPEIRPLKDKVTQDLTALVTRRRQIVEMIVAESNRLASASKTSQRDIKTHIRWLKKRLDQIDTNIKGQIRKSPLFLKKDKILQSTPGVGPTTAATLICGVPELGTMNRKKIACLVGLAPLNRDSGHLRGRRMIWGGRAHVRSVLYMSTLSAIQFNPIIRQFYNRLREAGKCNKVAMTACMRKLLTILNAMVRDQRCWQ
jgi:transposase